MLFGLVLLSAAGILAQNTSQFTFAGLSCGIYPMGVLIDPLPPFPDGAGLLPDPNFVFPANVNSQTEWFVRVSYDSTTGNDSDYGDPSGISAVGIPALGMVIPFGPSNATSYNKVVEFNLNYDSSFTPWNISLINATITRPLNGWSNSITISCLSIRFNVIYAPPPVRPYQLDGEYVYGNWSACDRQCGTGFQTRTVQCMVNGSEVEFYRCPDPIETDTIKTCNTQNCITDYYRQWDYFSHRCNNLCGGPTYQLQRPTPGCRIGGTDNFTDGCNVSTFPNNTILCPQPSYNCSWFLAPYSPSCANGTNVTRWYECRTSTGVRLTPQDCLKGGIAQDFSITRKCLGDPVINSPVQTIVIYKIYEMTVYGDNFSPNLQDNAAQFFDVNETLIPSASLQITNVSSNGKTAILRIFNIYLTSYIDQTISIQWWNGNANSSQITPFMKVVTNGSFKLSPSFIFALLFLLSLYL